MTDRGTHRWTDWCGLMAALISAVGKLWLLIFSVNENVAVVLSTSLLLSFVCV